MSKYFVLKYYQQIYHHFVSNLRPWMPLVDVGDIRGSLHSVTDGAGLIVIVAAS